MLFLNYLLLGYLPKRFLQVGKINFNFLCQIIANFKLEEFKVNYNRKNRDL